jgi:lipopolysaccharide export LptBFGC system permease protein LptF
MTVLIKLFYAGALTALLILCVAFGVRTFYSGPEEPEYPQVPFARPLDPSDPALQELEEEQQRYQEEYERYQDERAKYRRNVFFAATVHALISIAVGVSISAHLDALRLGLVAGGLGMLLYAVVQAGGDLDEVGSAMVFVVAVLGLALVTAAGYRWLRTVDTEGR